MVLLSMTMLAQFLAIKQAEVSIIMVGLDNSGKTSILNHLKNDNLKEVDIVPSDGFTVEKLESNTLTITAFDLSSQGRYRTPREQYYRDCQGVIFVVDSSDKIRIAVAKEELKNLHGHSEMRNKRIPILFFANKQDLPDALSTVKVSTIMALDSIRDKPWHICASNGLTGEGIPEGTDWLTNQIKDQLDAQK